MTNSDHFAWVDDLVKRWPVITLVAGFIGWMTIMQVRQEAMAREINGVPELKISVGLINKKLDAVILALGYKVEYIAVKQEEI